MTFASRLTRSPDPYDPARGADVAAAFASSLPELVGLIAGTAGCSPYLAGLIAKETVWLREALDAPEAALEKVLASIADLTLPDLSVHLRQAKRRVAVLTALADLGGVWVLEDITRALSRLSDACVDVCVKRLVAAEMSRGKLPAVKADDFGEAAGMVVLAMGKGGAFELNYSSDIDLICLFDETRFSPKDYHEARAAFIRVTRKMTSLLSEITSEGYVFRTDLRLRPDPSVTPICISMDAAERYYESVGRTWERAAYIKARAAAGDIAAGQRFLDMLRPFVWRKHLDYVAIQDAHDMRLRIREHKGLGGPITLPGHNMKLGRGGIREIEFFTQTRQLIAGGRDAELRQRDTLGGLAALARKGWVGQDDAETLTRHYRAHREIEHRLQMIRDAQTHDLPGSEDGFDRLAAFAGTPVAQLKKDLSQSLEEVHAVTEGFFAPTTSGPAPTFGTDVVERWHSYPALRSPRAIQIFERLKPRILSAMQDAAKPEEALAAFDEFLSRLPAGVQVFSLFEANPQLTQLIVDIVGTAPALAHYLAQNAAVFDAVIGGDFFAPWPGCQVLTQEADGIVGRADDYEAKLDAVRRWMKEWHFRVGVHYLRGLTDPDTAGAQYADLAESCLKAIYPVVISHFSRKHGPPPGRGAVVLGMGSLGAGRLHAASDLDLIVIYDGQSAEMSEGPRPLSTRSYYARLTQALVTAMSAPMAEGRLYNVDMRLRPSGGQGPVATSLARFGPYQSEEAWTWEHLALTRARVVAGPSDLAQDVEAVRCAVLAEKRHGETIEADVADMRRRIAAAKPPDSRFDAKLGPGRLQDVELAAQMLTLRAGRAVRSTSEQIKEANIAPEIARALDDAAALFWSVQSSAQLLIGGSIGEESLGEGGWRMLSRATGQETLDALAQTMQDTSAKAAQAIEALLGPGVSTGDTQ